MITATRKHMHLNRALQRDPTRTTTISRRFRAELDHLFAELMRDIRVSIINRDCFGFIPGPLKVMAADDMLQLRIGQGRLLQLAPTPARAFDFRMANDKIQAFMTWLQEQEDAGILRLVTRQGTGRAVPGFVQRAYAGTVPEYWTNTYVDSAYQAGIRSSRAGLIKEGAKIPSFATLPGGISAYMNQPFHADRVAAVYSRTFEELKSVMAVTNAQVRRQLTEGLTTGLARGVAEGKNPVRIARELVNDVNSRVSAIGINRARMIARTEIIRAHHVATMGEYRLAQQEIGPDYKVMADWLLGANPCATCIDLESDSPYELDKVEGLQPAHPHCVCTTTPRIVKLSARQAARRAEAAGIPWNRGLRVRPRRTAAQRADAAYKQRVRRAVRSGRRVPLPRGLIEPKGLTPTLKKLRRQYLRRVRRARLEGTPIPNVPPELAVPSGVY